MTPLGAVAVAVAGVAAGTINTIVGSGTLITFPTLLALGFPPVVANVSNNIGLVAGGLSGSWGYRRELSGQRGRLLRLGPASLLGGIAGAVLLLVLPSAAFEAIVPALLALALGLVLVQPRLQTLLQRRREQRTLAPGAVHTTTLTAGVGLAGVYGGYFGAAQGVLLVGLLGSMLPESLQRVNATKNVLSLLVNAVSAVVFLLVARNRIDWLVVGLISAGSVVGGQLGAHTGRRLPPPVLRAVIVVVGLVAIVKILLP